MNINENIEDEKEIIETQWGVFTKQVAKRAMIAHLRASKLSLTSKCFKKKSRNRAFVFSRPSYANVRSLNVPKVNSIQAFTQVLVSNNFDETSNKNEQARMETPLSPFTAMRYFSDTQGKLIHSKWSRLVEIESQYIFVTCKFKKGSDQ